MQLFYFLQALAMFLIVYAISFPLDEGVSHGLSITGTLLYVLLHYFLFHILHSTCYDTMFPGKVLVISI
jgi:hypothetical protein